MLVISCHDVGYYPNRQIADMGTLNRQTNVDRPGQAESRLSVVSLGAGPQPFGSYVRPWKGLRFRLNFNILQPFNLGLAVRLHLNGSKLSFLLAYPSLSFFMRPIA